MEKEREMEENKIEKEMEENKIEREMEETYTITFGDQAENHAGAGWIKDPCQLATRSMIAARYAKNWRDASTWFK